MRRAVPALGPLLAALGSCAGAVPLTRAETAALGAALDAVPPPPRAASLVLEAETDRGPGGELHVAALGGDLAVVMVDPLGISWKAVLTREVLWMRARPPGGREVRLSCDPADGPAMRTSRCRALLALRRLAPFLEAPLPVAGAARAYLAGPVLVAESPPGPMGLVERRYFAREDLACVRREILFQRRVLAVLEQEGATPPVAGRLRVAALGLDLRLRLLEMREEEDLPEAIFLPDPVQVP